MKARNSVMEILTAAILAIGLLGCREPSPPAPPTVAAPIMEPSALPTATPAPTEIPTITPDPLPVQIIGRWRSENAEDGLAYVTVIEFFADGLFSAIVEGQVSPCLLLPDFCGLFPDQLPFALSFSGPYLFLDEERIRLEIEEEIDPTIAYFLKQFDQRLEAFNIVRLEANTLVLQQDGVSYVYERVQ